MARDNIQELTQSIAVNKKTTFNWTFVSVFAGPFISALILMILTASGTMHPDSWINWTLALVFIPMILMSLIIAQRRKLIGAYGETILLLIPTFVWLLPGHDESKKYMVYMAFAIIAIGLLMYTIGNLFKYLKTKNTPESEERKRKLIEIFLRVGFIGAAVTSTLIISIILINWGDFSLDLAPKVLNTNKELVTDYTSKTWITFIAVVTILIALTLVILGLVSNTKEKYRKSFSDNRFGFSHKEKQKTKQVSSKTVAINLKPKKHKKKKFKQKSIKLKKK